MNGNLVIVVIAAIVAFGIFCDCYTIVHLFGLWACQ